MSAPEIEPQIAISYSRRDESRVVPILDGLRAKGLAVWFDKDIPGGTLWEEIIARKYRAASGLAFFLSRASLESQRCFEEVSTARTLGKPIFPVLLERMKLPDELPDRFVLTLQARNVIDVIDDDAEAAVAKLLRAFDAHGVKPGDAPVAPPVPTPIPKPAPAAAAPTAPLPPRAATPSPAVLGGIVGGLVVAIGIALWATGVFGGGGAPARPLRRPPPPPRRPLRRRRRPRPRPLPVRLPAGRGARRSGRAGPPRQDRVRPGRADRDRDRPRRGHSGGRARLPDPRRARQRRVVVRALRLCRSRQAPGGYRSGHGSGGL